PPVVYGEPDKEGKWKGFQEIIETKNLEKEGKRIEDYTDWSYTVTGGRIDLTFSPTSKELMAIACYSDDRLRRCPVIAGKTDGNTEQEVIRRLGKPDIARTDGVMKYLNYKNIGVNFWLTKEQVYMLGINDIRYDRSK